MLGSAETGEKRGGGVQEHREARGKLHSKREQSLEEHGNLSLTAGVRILLSLLPAKWLNFSGPQLSHRKKGDHSNTSFPGVLQRVRERSHITALRTAPGTLSVLGKSSLLLLLARPGEGAPRGLPQAPPPPALELPSRYIFHVPLTALLEDRQGKDLAPFYR